MRARGLLLLLVVSGGLLVGCDSSTNKATGAREVEPVVLTLANWQRGEADVGEWVRAVDRFSRGGLKIEVRGGWRRGEVEVHRGMLADVRAGRVDLGHIPTGAWDTLGVDSFQALEAPLLVDSFDLQERVLTGELGASMLASVRSAEVEPIGLLPGGLRRPVGVSRDLLGSRDYAGARIGLAPSTVHEKTMRALGAEVVGRPVGGVLAGLDGTEADLAAIDFDGYDQQARGVTANVVLWPRASTIVMNRDAWERLTGGQRALLRRAARAAVGPAMRRQRDFERSAAQPLCERGFPLVRASAGEMATLRRRVEPVYRALARDRATRRALAQIRALKADLPAEPIPSCGAQRSRPPAPVAGPLVGDWELDVTREQMAAAPRMPQEEIEDSWGDFTLVLGPDGRFELLNDRYPTPVGLGTWSVRGDVLEIVAAGDLGQGVGETWRYQWTLFRGSLQLRRLASSRGPTPLTVAPLHRR